jgi:ribosomal protein L29
MGTAYETDIAAWATEQAALLRQGRLAEVDALNIAEEIEDVGRSEQHELSSRLAVLLAHLLKWKYQSHLRGTSWEKTIREQRRAVARRLRRAPSLKHMFSDEEWLEETWDDAARLARNETGFFGFPDHWIWTPDEVLDQNFFPD